MLNSWLILPCSYPESRDQNTPYSCLVHIFGFYFLIYILYLEHGVNIRDSFWGHHGRSFLLAKLPRAWKWSTMSLLWGKRMYRYHLVLIQNCCVHAISTVDHPTWVNTMIDSHRNPRRQPSSLRVWQEQLWTDCFVRGSQFVIPSYRTQSRGFGTFLAWLQKKISNAVPLAIQYLWWQRGLRTSLLNVIRQIRILP